MLVRTSLPDQVFHRLVSDVLAGRYAPGERLPTQRALAAELGVNMASVREGVKRLEQLGLVEVRHGDAMRVLDWRLHGGPDVLVHLIARAGSLDVEMVRSVMEARRLLLSESGRLAAGRRSEEQAALLVSLADQLATARRRRGAASRLRVLRGADRGGRQRRLPARHELDPGAVPGEPRAVPPARLEPTTRTPARRRRCARATATARRRSSPGSRPRRKRGCWRRCREGPLPPRGGDLRRLHRCRGDARAALAGRRRDRRDRGLRRLAGERAARQPHRDPRLPARARHPAARPRPRRARRRAARPRPHARGGAADGGPARGGRRRVLRRRRRDAAPRLRRGRAGAARRGDPRRRASRSRPGGIVDLSGFAGTRTVRADVAVIGSGAGGAVVAKELAEAGAQRRPARGGRAARRGGVHRAPARHAPAPVPRRRAARDARAAADPAAARPRRRRHDAGQLRHLLPHARPRARALA